jgi:aspergillopepsin I
MDLYSDRAGTVDFGFVDKNKYVGDIAYGPLDVDQGNWNFEMTGYAIGADGAEVGVAPFRGVVDSGGPNMGLPKEIVEPYFASFGGFAAEGNSHNFPCERYPPPDLVLVMATGDQLVLNSTWLVRGGESPWGNGTCQGRVDDSVQGSYNIGASVLDQKFVVFDHVHARVGFADKASFSREGGEGGCTSPPSNATRLG